MLSDCKKTENGFDCLSTCESVWFKIWNITAAGSTGAACDKIFIGQYANVMWYYNDELIIGNMIARMDQLITLCM